MNTTCSVRLCFDKTCFSNISLSAWMPTYFQKGPPPRGFSLLLTCWGLLKPGEDFHHRIICTKLLWVDSYVSSDHTERQEEWSCYIQHQTILSGISWQGGVMSVWSRSRWETQAGLQQAQFLSQQPLKAMLGVRFPLRIINWGITAQMSKLSNLSHYLRH